MPKAPPLRPKEVCKACKGSGKSSKGKKCYPCNGTGKTSNKGEKR